MFTEIARAVKCPVPLGGPACCQAGSLPIILPSFGSPGEEPGRAGRDIPYLIGSKVEGLRSSDT